MERVICVRNIHKEFKLSRKQRKKKGLQDSKVIAVNDISFDVYKGEILCILGNNGAGKTTTLQVLSTLLKPDSGSVEYQDFNVVKDRERIRRKITFLSTELKLDEDFSVDYLYDFFSALYKVPENTTQERKEKVFKMLGVDKYSNIKVGNLSTGMKQKAALAISLVHDPDIIILDEPTNGLDIIASREVVEFLLEEKKNNKTIIISTHIFELVNKVADRIIMIDKGNVIYEGGYKEIQDKGGIEGVFFEKYDEERRLC